MSKSSLWCLQRVFYLDLAFSLVLDDFSMLHINKSNLDKLFYALNKEYQTTADLTGSKFLGFNLN